MRKRLSTRRSQGMRTTQCRSLRHIDHGIYGSRVMARDSMDEAELFLSETVRESKQSAML